MDEFSSGSFDVNEVKSHGVAKVSYGGDASLAVRFYDEAIESQFKSEEAGRPVFVTKTMIEIHIPGGKNVVVRPVEEADKDKYPKQWERYCNKSKVATDGTPIEHWPMLKTQQVYELKAMGFFTVEQLANMSDGQGSHIGMGYRNLRTQAQAFLDFAVESAAVQKTAAEREELKRENEEMRKQILELARQVEVLQRGKKIVASEAEISDNAASESAASAPIPAQSKEPVSSLDTITAASPYKRRGRPAKKEN